MFTPAGGDGIDVHVELARHANRVRERAGLIGVMRRVGNPERQARDVGFGAPVQRPGLRHRGVRGFGVVAAAVGRLRAEPFPKGRLARLEIERARDVVVAVIAIDDQRPADLRGGIERVHLARDGRELGLQIPNLIPHAARRVDHERDVEARVCGALLAEAQISLRALLGAEPDDPLFGLRVEKLLEERVVEVVVPGPGGESARLELTAPRARRRHPERVIPEAPARLVRALRSTPPPRTRARRAPA